MSRAKCSEELKEQVVREVIVKGRSIVSVAASCDLVPQTVGNRVAKHRKEHGSAEEREAAAEAAEGARLKKHLRKLQQGCEFLKKSGGLACEGTAVGRKYELTGREEGSCPISSMRRWARVSRSGCYSWRDRPRSRSGIRRRELVAMIEPELKASDGTYGYRRIAARLGRRGVVVHQDTVRGLMRRAGLVVAWPRRKVRTTTPAADLGVRLDLMRRDFTAEVPGVKWAGDITCIRTWAGFVSLAAVLDCATKKVVGYAMADPCAHLPGVRGHRYGRA